MTSNIDTPTPIPRATFASMVCERIRSSIIDGGMPPGSQLNEVELAASFGVSRGPVREALQRLVQEGLLRSEPHRGVFVPVMTPEDIDDIYAARNALETAAVQVITGSSKSSSVYKALDRVVQAMQKAEDAGDWQAVANTDLDFHTILVAAAESPRIERMFSTVISETRLCLSVLTGTYKGRDGLVEEHRRIIELIRANDSEGAVELLRRGFDDAVVTLKQRLVSDGDSAAG